MKTARFAELRWPFCASYLVRLCLCTGVVLSLCACGEPISPQTVAIKAARFAQCHDDGVKPPVRDEAWSDVQLPHNLTARRHTLKGHCDSTNHLDEGIGWYRMTFSSPTGWGGVGILVRRLSMNGEIFVNGVRVLSGGRMAPPVTRNWNTPFYVEIPGELLRPGENVLDVRIYAYVNSNGGLGVVYVGDPEELRTAYVYLRGLHVEGALVSLSVALIAAFISLVAWWRMKQASMYGLFGLAMVAWAVHAARYTNYFVSDVPLQSALYGVVANSAQGWFFVLFTRFLLRFTQRKWCHFEQALLWFAVLATAGMYAAFRGVIPLFPVVGLWLLVWIPGSTALLVLSTRHALQVRSFPAVMAALVMWTYVPVTFRDLLISANLLPFDTSYVGHYVGIPLVVLIAWMLVDRAVQAVHEAGQAEIERQRAAFDERQRMTQDMHDGLGVLLTASLCQVSAGDLDRDRLADSLRACCEELRLIVDSSSVGPAEFLPILATLRHRMQSRLGTIGIKVNWRMDAFPPDLVLPQRTSLQVLRIVQEAMNNAIKHAKASVIDIATVDTADQGQVGILIRDNGVGFDTRRATPGKGLSGMMRRAASIPATLDIRSSSRGTSIELVIPVAAPSPGTRHGEGQA